MLISIALDPDYKSPYLGLSNLFLLQKQFQKAIEASEKCLQRHNDTPHAQFNIGQALCHMLQLGQRDVLEEERMVDRAKDALYTASKRPEQWNEDDDQMLDFLIGGPPRTNMKVPLHTWKVYGFRP